MIEKEVRSESGRRGNQGAVKSVANQMKEKSGEMPTLAAAASELGSRGNQGALEATVRSGLPRKVAPRFNGKRIYDGRTDAILRAGITLEEAAGELSRRANNNKRIGTRDCATENCKKYNTTCRWTMRPLPQTGTREEKGGVLHRRRRRGMWERNRTSKSMQKMVQTS